MRGKSHISLGKYLAEQYMSDAPKRYVRAFLIGCVEPDRNPATYLKGSLRSQWLRGHNFGNALPYMQKIARRLEQKTVWNLLDYYTMGKLIHYTADAFTYAHNKEFSPKLSCHRAYEQALQEHFLEFLGSAPEADVRDDGTVISAIWRYHREYIRRAADIRNDARFALNTCCCVLALLSPGVRQPAS